MNPDYIVAGECLGEESYGLIAAARNGYPILSTIHADSAQHALHNLITMALEATETQSSVSVVHATIKARPMIVVALARRPDGKRQLEEVIEVLQEPGTSTPRTEPLYERTIDDALVQTTPPSHALLTLLATTGSMPKEFAL
jgi:Flp pilus assembly CpaF family ATPase